MNDSLLKKTIILTLLIVSFSILYHLVLRPIHRDNELGRCLEKAYQERSYVKQSIDYCFQQY